MKSEVSVFTFRLRPHQDLKTGLRAYCVAHDIQAGVIVTCVGSLEQYHLRFANQPDGSKQSGHFEILSLSGTVSSQHLHLHLCIADEQGHVIGGHLLDDNLIYTTAEVCLMKLEDLIFLREHDPLSGYQELTIHKKPS